MKIPPYVRVYFGEPSQDQQQTESTEGITSNNESVYRPKPGDTAFVKEEQISETTQPPDDIAQPDNDMQSTAVEQKVPKDKKVTGEKMAEQNKEVVFGEITKGPDTKVVVSFSNYNNRNYINLREYWKPENKDFLPTKKGFTLPVDEPEMVDDLIAILQKAKEYLEKL